MCLLATLLAVLLMLSQFFFYAESVFVTAKSTNASKGLDTKCILCVLSNERAMQSHARVDHAPGHAPGYHAPVDQRSSCVM